MSVTDLLKAGKLVKPPATNIVTVYLESYDVRKIKWVKSGSQLEIEETRFAHGAFGDAFRATAIDKEVTQSAWVVKQYQEKAVNPIEVDLGMSLEHHTRKQVQMNVVERPLTKRFTKSVPSEFGNTFEDVKVFFSVYKELPSTIEEFVEGEFQKYLNNNGMSIPSPADEFNKIYAKAQCLLHYCSYKASEQKLMLLDILSSCMTLRLQQQIY